MKWILLASAIISEVAASLSLKAALNDPVFFIIVVAGYIASFAYLAGVLRAAAGVALTTVASRIFFKEHLTPS